MNVPTKSITPDKPKGTEQCPAIVPVPRLYGKKDEKSAESTVSGSVCDFADTEELDIVGTDEMLRYGLMMFGDKESESAMEIAQDYHFSKPPLKVPYYDKKDRMFNDTKYVKEFTPYYGPSIAMRATAKKLPFPLIMRGGQWRKKLVHVPLVKTSTKPPITCILCQLRHVECDSVPGNGRCSRCEAYGDDMICRFSNRWYEFMHSHPYSEHFYYVFPAPCFDEKY